MDMLCDAHILGLNDAHLRPLASINAYGKSRDFALVEAAGNAFVAMQAAARADGIDCQITSGYRSFATQLNIWQRKWLGQRTIVDDHEQVVDITRISDVTKLHAILRYSALPGASRHHWGTDIDVYDAQAVAQTGHTLQLVASEYAEHGVCHALSQWLDSHAHRFGFIRPYAKDTGGIGVEPWHLSYAPVATPLLARFPITALSAHLGGIDIAGQRIILDNLDTIYRRYILNHGITDA